LGQFKTISHAKFQGFWDFKLDRISLGETDLPLGSPVAIVDSGSSIIVGPIEPVGKIAKLAGALCFEAGDTPEDVSPVECERSTGFDVAAVDCRIPFPDLVFTSDGVNYSLKWSDLLLPVAGTSDPPICILKILGSFELPGWCKYLWIRR
jgi:hypothetical protein